MGSIHIQKVSNSISLIEFNTKNKTINFLSSDILKELKEILIQIDNNPQVQYLVFTSAKENNFIAGADINEIIKLSSIDLALESIAEGQKIMNLIENMNCTTISIINGSCLGGGTELALSCDFRLGTNNPSFAIGLPEVNLGVIPGFGGTQRLPRLISLTKALSMIVTGKQINLHKAKAYGLIDHILPTKYDHKTIKDFVEEYMEDPKKLSALWRDRHKKKSKLDKISFIRKIYFKLTMKYIQKKLRNNYPAPIAAVHTIEKTYAKNLNYGLTIERNKFAHLVTGDISKHLINLFFIQQSVKKIVDYDGTDITKQTYNLNSVLLLGAGVMGSGIAWLMSYNMIKVRIKDISLEAIDKAYKHILQIYNKLVSIKKVQKHNIRKYKANISHTTTDDHLGNPEIVIEAVVENIKVKSTILQSIEQQVDKNTIIATNTSSLSVSELAKSLTRPKKFLGIHFFNPVDRMPLVEIIATPQTSDDTIFKAMKLVINCKKFPILVSDCAGFLVNRILLPYINEALFMLESGEKIDYIDNVIQNFGMPMGPFALADQVGLDVGFKVLSLLEDAYGERMKTSPIAQKLQRVNKCLGKKTHKGFYIYKTDKQKESTVVNKEIYQIIKKNSTLSKHEVINRCMLIMINEAALCLEEEVIKNVQLLDLAMVMGIGFPPFKGGLCAYADKVGIPTIVKKLRRMEKSYGVRFKPAPLLLDMQESGKTFYTH